VSRNPLCGIIAEKASCLVRLGLLWRSIPLLALRMKLLPYKACAEHYSLRFFRTK
jgi:hypothetical protein